ncbi:MAG TPA: HIT family protein [Candidatus Paceibacterota bacterium]|nr:HIT family protein [Candidatus Paceibacterota bacterium]
MNDCLFCKIIAQELPSFTVYEDDATLAFLDIHPVNPGHTLVVPKQHATNIFDIESASWSHVAETVRKVASALEKGLEADGVNLMMNNREHAGQVIDHPHMHVIPRFVGDGLKLWPHKEYKDGEAQTLVEKIRATLS